MNAQVTPTGQSSLADWLNYLESLHTQAIDLGLARVSEVARRLDLGVSLGARRARVITFAGTNGKGSTLTLTQALLVSAGYRVGSYTSPHLLHFNERIQLQGQMVSDERIVEAFQIIEQARTAADPVSLTYFEFTTLAALWLFQQELLDFWLLEVGLGGRLDAVNLVDADLAVITSVDLDHQDYLGHDRESIGAEKAGILRIGMPVVLGQEDMPLSVLHRADQLHCSVFQIGRDYQVQQLDDQHWCYQPAKGQSLMPLKKPNLPLINAATALQVLQQLQCLPDIAQINQVLGSLVMPGRMQRIGTWLLDVAHNPHAARYLASQLGYLPARRRLLLVGMMADKDIQGTLQPLLAQVAACLPVSLPLPRAAGAAQLAAVLQSLNAEVVMQDAEGDGKAAWLYACQSLQQGLYDEVLVTGSFHTLALFLPYLEAGEHTCVMA